MNGMDFETFAPTSGDPKDMYRTEEFDTERILKSLEHYYSGGYPAWA
jgi:hypothetical protein